MPRRGLKTLLLGVLLAGTLLLSAPRASQARPGWLTRGATVDAPLPSQAPSGRLQEVAPPGAVQDLRRKLSVHQPQLKLLRPADGSVISSNGVDLELAVKDWPVSRDLQLGLGPHVAVQVDDRAPIRLDQMKDGQVQLHLDGLSPGSHRFSAWAAYPWGEAVKTPGAAIQGRWHLWQKLAGTQPEPDAPWLVPIPASGSENRQPLLLDWLIWNAPLQNLRDGDGRWRLRISLDGDSFLVDHQDALWLKGSGSSGSTVQMELLNAQGEPLQPVFNNRLIRLEADRRDRPVWLKARLSEDELERLSGTPQQEHIDPEPSLQRSPAKEEQDDDQEAQEEAQQADVASEPVVATAEEPTTEPELATVDDSIEEAVDEAIDDDDDPTPLMDPAPAPQQLEPDPAPVRQPEPLLRPESSLGGSARELLNPDGRLKQP
ncbi:MAG: hypothetical protein O2972_06540 [Cyanobacteria bacterium]|nr:hypothetical protein [Cyanobacteriota bacterium]